MSARGCVSVFEGFVLFGQQSGFVVTWAVLTQRIFERGFPNSFCSPYSVCRRDVSNSCLGGYTAPIEVKLAGKTMVVLGARRSC